jgi:hypothetical protein
MRVRTAASCLLACVFVAGSMLTGACNRNQGSERAIDAAIVPGAEVVARIDVQAIRAAPIIKKLAEARENAGNADSKAKLEKFQEATGLTREDVLAVVISADADSVDLANGMAPENLSHMTGVAAIELARPLDTDKLIEGLKAVLDDGGSTEISKIRIGESEAVFVESTKQDKSSAYAATSSDAKTVYLAFNKASLQAALQREKEGKMVNNPSGLQAIPGASSQASVAFVAPEGLREMIREQLSKAKESPGAAMMEGFIAPFKDLRSVSIGVNCGTGMRLEIAGDLGQAQAATQVAALLQTMAMPMLKRLAVKSSGKMPSKLEDKFEVSVEGTVLRISMSFTGEDLGAYQKAKAGAKTAARYDRKQGYHEHSSVKVR